MAIKFLPDNEGKSDDLPWANDFLDEGGEPGTMTSVKSIKSTQKGYLVVGELFKGFIFKGQQTYDFLADAIKEYTSEPRLPFTLVIEVKKGGRIALGVDDDMSCIFITDKKNGGDFKLENGSCSSNQKIENPFLTKVVASSCTPESHEDKEDTSTSKKTKKPF